MPQPTGVIRQFALAAVVAVGLCGIAGQSAPASAAPSAVTFDTFLGQHFFDINTPTATSEGYDFTSLFFHFHIGDSLPAPPNPTGALLQDIHDNVITMTKNGGGAFDFLSVDIAQVALVNTPFFQATGYFSGGGSISATVTLPSLMQTANFSGFLNVTSVEFVGIGANPLFAVNVFWLDNVVVSTPPTTSNIPLPATAAMFGAVILAMPLYRRFAPAARHAR